MATGAVAQTSGSCGDNLEWTLSEDGTTLSFSGYGPMTNYEYSGTNITPWRDNAGTITTVDFSQAQEITTIGDYAFYKCSALPSITIPENVTSIGTQAFGYCSSFTTFTIPDNVVTLGYSLFDDCINLKTIYIGKSCTTFYYYYNCSSLEEYIVDPENTTFASLDGVLFSKDMKTLCKYPSGKKDVTYEIPDTVITIENIYDNSYLENLIFPESMEYIGGDNIVIINDCANLKTCTFYSAAAPDLRPSAISASSPIALYVPKNSVGYVGGVWSKFFKLPEQIEQVDVTLNEYGFAAYCPVNCAVEVPTNVEVYTIGDISGLSKIKANKVNTSSIVLAADAGVLLKGTPNSTVKFTYVGTAAKVEGGAERTAAAAAAAATSANSANANVSNNLKYFPSTLAMYDEANAAATVAAAAAVAANTAVAEHAADATEKMDAAGVAYADFAAKAEAAYENFKALYESTRKYEYNSAMYATKNVAPAATAAAQAYSSYSKDVLTEATAADPTSLDGNTLVGVTSDMLVKDPGYYAFKMDGEDPVMAPLVIVVEFMPGKKDVTNPRPVPGAVGKTIPAGQVYTKPATYGNSNVLIDFGTPTGIETVEAETDGAPARYYDLRGIEMPEGTLAPGLYIRRCGTKADKVVVK